VSKLAWIPVFAALAAVPATAETAVPDLRGTWTGESESIVLGGANPHHATGTPAPEPRLSSIAFTLTVDKQDGRRFSGKFTSARTTDTIIAVVSHSGSIYLVDDDGYTVATMLAPTRMELCYMHLSPASRGSGSDDGGAQGALVPARSASGRSSASATRAFAGAASSSAGRPACNVSP
jgi:hypothetical protein